MLRATLIPATIALIVLSGFDLGPRSQEEPQADQREGGRSMYRYMLEGVATPEVFAALIKAPADRGDNARGLVEKAGCKLVDYYVGIHNYKSYVIIDCPDEDSLAALLLTLYASGTFGDATATRIVDTAQLKSAFEDAQELVGSHKTPK